MMSFAEVTGLLIKARGHHYIMFEVTESNYFGMEEVTAQEFMNHHIISTNQYFDN